MTQFTSTTSTPLQAENAAELRWTPVCTLSDILPGGGTCALVAGQQVAVFRVAGQVFAVSNFDPFTRANVLSRGLTGSYTTPEGERYKVASPLLKHAFDLASGAYLGGEDVSIQTYPVQLDGETVMVGMAG